MPYNMFIAATRVAEDPDDEETQRRVAAERLGPDWTVMLAEGDDSDVPAA